MYHNYFFFHIRIRHTRWPRDWSSDVCSSDLQHQVRLRLGEEFLEGEGLITAGDSQPAVGALRGEPFGECGALGMGDVPGPHPGTGVLLGARSEERRVGNASGDRLAP